MKSAFSTNFWSPTIFVLTIFDFGWKNIKTTTITTEKTTKTGVQTKLNRKPSKISFYKSVLRNYVGWTQARQIAHARKSLRSTPLMHRIVPAIGDARMQRGGYHGGISARGQFAGPVSILRHFWAHFYSFNFLRAIFLVLLIPPVLLFFLLLLLLFWIFFSRNQRRSKQKLLGTKSW